MLRPQEPSNIVSCPLSHPSVLKGLTFCETMQPGGKEGENKCSGRILIDVAASLMRESEMWMRWQLQILVDLSFLASGSPTGASKVHQFQSGSECNPSLTTMPRCAERI